MLRVQGDWREYEDRPFDVTPEIRAMRIVLSMLFAMSALAPFAFPARAAAPERHATLPAASPDGRRVAYLRESGPRSCELHVVRIDGREDRVVRTLGITGGVPAWTDRGARVTVAVNGPDSTCLLASDLEGRAVTTIASLPAKSLARSHDGRWIAWTSGSWTRSRVMVSDSAGGHTRALTDSAAAWYNLAWSPDDRSIAVTRNAPGAGMQVWLLDPAGGGARALTAFPDSLGRPQWPAWSRDGRRIALQCNRSRPGEPGTKEADLWIVDVASGEAKRLTVRDRPWLDEAPTWAGPHLLVFQSTRSGRFELWTIRDDGRGAKALTH